MSSKAVTPICVLGCLISFFFFALRQSYAATRLVLIQEPACKWRHQSSSSSRSDSYRPQLLILCLSSCWLKALNRPLLLSWLSGEVLKKRERRLGTLFLHFKSAKPLVQTYKINIIKRHNKLLTCFSYPCQQGKGVSSGCLGNIGKTEMGISTRSC